MWQIIIEKHNEILEIVLLSLQVSLSAVVIATIVGLPIAALLVTTSFRGKKIIITTTNTLLGIPSVVLGLSLYLLFSRAGPLGALGILYTPTAMIIAQSLLVLPIIIALSRGFLQASFTSLEEFFFSLRLSKWQMAKTILFEKRFALITVLLTAFGRAISEVGAVMVVGGNINHVTRVMTTTIAMETNKGNLAFSLWLGVMLLVIVFAVNLFANGVQSFEKRWQLR